MVKRDHHGESSTNRRKFLYRAGAAGFAVSIAGCSSEGGTPTPTGDGGDGADGGDGTSGDGTSGDGGDATDTTQSSGGEVVSPTMQELASSPPDEIQVPPVGGDLPGGYPLPGYGAAVKPVWDGSLEDPYSVFRGHYAKSSQLLDDNKTWRIEFKQDPQFKWEDGRDVNIKDRWWTEKYNRQHLMKTTDNTPDFAELRMVDDYTMEQVYQTEIHPGSFFTGRHAEFRRPRWIAKPWAEKMIDATTEQEAADIHQNMTSSENTIGLDEIPSCGQWKLDEIRDVEVIYTTNEQHPYSDRQNIDEVRITFKGNESARRLAWENGEVDHGANVPANTSLPEGYETQTRRSPRSAGLWLNRANNPHLKRRGVRRAIAYALHNEAISANVQNDTFGPAFIQGGMPEVVGQAWHPNWEEFKSNAIDYGTTAQPDKARQELENAGYTEDGNGWVGPDGNTLEFNYIDNGWWPLYSETIKSNFDRVGIALNVNLSENFGQLNVHDDRDWHISMASHGPRYNNYVGGCFTNKSYGPLGGFPIEEFQEDDDPGQFGVPHEVTIPSEIGQKEVSGDGETLNLVELRQVFSEFDVAREDLIDAAEKFARYWQYDVPKPLISDAIVTSTRNTGDFIYEDINGDGTNMSQFENNIALQLGLNKSKVE